MNFETPKFCPNVNANPNILTNNHYFNLGLALLLTSSMHLIRLLLCKIDLTFTIT